MKFSIVLDIVGKKIKKTIEKKRPKNGKFYEKSCNFWVSLLDKKLQQLPTFIVCLVWLQEKVAIYG